MTTLNGRTATALVIIDLQVEVIAQAHDRAGTLERVQQLLGKARSAGVPVVWVRHSDDDLEVGSQGWEIVPELVPASADVIVEKHYGDSFEETDLESHLAAASVGHLVVAGAQTDACVRSTLHGGFTRGYDVTLVGDAHTTEDRTQWGGPDAASIIAHTNIYWNYHDGPGRTAKVSTVSELEFA